MAQSTIVGQDNERVKTTGSTEASSKRSSAKTSGSRFNRSGATFTARYTQPGRDALEGVVWERRQSVITNPDGSVVFKMEGAEIPAEWSQLATDIVVSKYFRKAGIHGDKDVGETSVRQVVHRIAHTIRTAGEQAGGYFATKKDADTFDIANDLHLDLTLTVHALKELWEPDPDPPLPDGDQKIPSYPPLTPHFP